MTTDSSVKQSRGLKHSLSIANTHPYLQLFGVVCWVSFVLGLMIIPTTLILFTPYSVWLRYAFLAYGLWMVYDRKSPSKGGWKTKGFRRWFKKWRVWKWFRDYFPATLVTTTKIDTTRNYIVGLHPHGVYCLSFFANVLFTPHFEQVTGLDVRVSTIPASFYLVLWRDFCLAIGAVSCEKNAMKRALDTKLAKGSCMVIPVGGGEEFTHMRKGTMDLVLAKRKGFVKLALQTGNSLLPVIAFGENELLERVTHPLLEPMHKILYKAFHMALPLFVGRFSLPLPRRVPLVTVVGKPIIVGQVLHPSDAEVDGLHAEYIKQLKQLYNEHKDVHHKDRICDLRIVA